MGEVAEIGPKVKKFRVGDKVAFGTCRDCCYQCKYCKIGYDNLCNGVPFKGTVRKSNYP